MASRLSAVFVSLVLAVTSVRAATYSLKDNFVGSSFLTGFTHEAIADPTHGRVLVAFLFHPNPPLNIDL